MSGHSKWATTKHKKAVVDAKRGKLFAKLIKNIEVAARTGGGDPDGNPTLFDAIQKARRTSVPTDNIDRAVKRGSGADAGGVDYQTIMYEGYGPGGVALLIECLTDNRNRAASEVRTAMTRNGGTMADPGSVSFLFSRKGLVIVPQQNGISEDDVLAATPCSMPVPRRSMTWASPSRSCRKRPTSSRCARRCSTPASITTQPTRASCPRRVLRWTPTPPARCSS
jgi:YebC/PmpR family DNA-binding regulatory protein